MITRHLTAKRINEIANHPEVYDWVRGPIKGPLDLSPLLSDPNNYMLVGEYGGILFTQCQPGLYEGHSAVLPEGRGKWSAKLIKECLHWMFTQTDAIEILARIPQGNLGVFALARGAGFKPVVRLDNGWVQDEKPIPATIYNLTIQDWILRSLELTKTAQEFHNKSGTVGNGGDQFVGASLAMLYGGQPYKAAVFYNRWASMANSANMAIVTLDPLAVKIDDTLLMVRGKDSWVIKCRSPSL